MIDTPITIGELLQQASSQLICSESARLDSEILLLKVLNDSTDRHHTKSWLLTWPEKTLTTQQVQQFQHYVSLRSKGTPIAYITGEKYFWTLTLNVSSDTLIPRPETELLVECALDKLTEKTSLNILDLGTGSGAIALAIASEHPDCQILASDISAEALQIAQNNAHQLSIKNIRFCQSHWFEKINEQRFDMIVSNPPYIAKSDPELEKNVKDHEPFTALYSGDDGLDDIREIIQYAENYLTTGGWILFEHGYTQSSAIQSLLKQYGFTQIATHNDLNHLPRVTQAQRH